MYVKTNFSYFLLTVHVAGHLLFCHSVVYVTFVFAYKCYII